MDPGEDEEEDRLLPLDGGAALLGRCTCDCPCCGFSSGWRRSMKRKLDAAPPPLPMALDVATARVEIENELMALREALARHHKMIQDLYKELEEERNSASTAASEAMSMILRLQREKAEAQMEARQFKRLADEKMAHDQQEIIILEDLLFKRDQALQCLSADLQGLRLRVSSFDPHISCFEPQTPTTPLSATAEIPPYPALRCTIPTVDFDLNCGDETSTPADLEKYAYGETPRDRLQNLEQRIYELERTPSSKVMEKGVVGYYYSPRRPRHLRRMSFDSVGSGSFRRGDEFPLAVERAGSENNEDTCDRVYTIDAVHGVSCEDSLNSTREINAGNGRDEGEIQKLYTRLQALEADRESMRQAIMSVGTEKAQMVLLKEIAQQLSKDNKPVEKKIVTKPSFIKSFSIMNAVKEFVRQALDICCFAVKYYYVDLQLHHKQFIEEPAAFLDFLTSLYHNYPACQVFGSITYWTLMDRVCDSLNLCLRFLEWVVSFVFWKKKAVRCRYPLGLSSNNPGLLLLLEKPPRMRQRRCLSRTRR